MKKVLYIAAIAGLALAACTKNNAKPEESLGSQVINFTPAVGMSAQLKDGPISGAVLPTDDSFYSIAYYKASSDASDSTMYVPLSTVSYTEDTWTTAIQYFWPKSTGSVLTFLSIYPAELVDNGHFVLDTTITNGWKSNGVYDVSEQQTYDVMIADAATGCTGSNSGSGVTTTFRHKLAYIKAIKLSTDFDLSSVASFTLNSVSLRNVHYQGSYTYNAWTSEDAIIDVDLHTRDVEFGQDGIDVDITYNGWYFLLPQTLSDDAVLELNYTVKILATGSEDIVKVPIQLNGKLEAFEMNKAYTFNIEVGTDVITWKPTVSTWDNISFSENI